MRRDRISRLVDPKASSENQSGQRRGRLQSLLRSFLPNQNIQADAQRGRLLLESLEQRQMLAGDVEMLFTDSSTETPTSGISAAQTDQSSGAAAATGLNRSAEGEARPDLVQFAKDLDDAGVIMYGAHWCPACTSQKQLFEDGGDNLPFQEVTDGNRDLIDSFRQDGIVSFPTWEFPNGDRFVGEQTLEKLEEELDKVYSNTGRGGYTIPLSENPTFETIGNKTVLTGAPLHIPIDAYDPDSGDLSVTVSVENDDLLEAVVLSGNRSIRFDMVGYDDMVFELFEQRAPAATGQVIDLANSDFYDGIIFHRVIDNFVIQGGDPTGTGSGGSPNGDFDDQFHPELQHTSTGNLSYAKSSDDTNDSQFFITEGPARSLDFNHMVFGQLVEGESVREAISEHATNASDRPTQDVTISEATIFNDTENSVLMLKSKGSATGTTNVTVTVTDGDDNSFSETFSVSVAADASNGLPYLNPVSAPATSPVNTPATLQLSATDVEGDAVRFFAGATNSSVTTTVNPDTGELTVTPADGFRGNATVEVGVSVAGSLSDFERLQDPDLTASERLAIQRRGDQLQDTQMLTFRFEGESVDTPTSIDLLSNSDTGVSDSDNITNAASLTFVVDGVTSGNIIELINTANGSVIGEATAASTTATVTTNNIAALGDGTYNIAARQKTASGTSEQTAPISVSYDSVAPSTVVGSASTQANVDRPYETNLISPEEGLGLVYSLASAPTGASIDASTGVVTWTPTEAQIGANTFALELTDTAGNVRTESFEVSVAGEPIAEIRLTITDDDGNPLSAVQVESQFNLNLIGADLRTGTDPNVPEEQRNGIFAAFADILFNSSLVRPVPGSTIQFDGNFPTVQKGTFSDGLIDEIGAATDRLTPSRVEESLIATIRMEALSTGSINIRSEPADETDSEVLLYGSNNRIPAETVAYGDVTLAIGQNFTVADDQITVDEDSGATQVDVLANDEVISGNGSLEIVSVTQPSSGAGVSVQGDRVAFLLDDDFNGEFTFTYRVRDSAGIQEDATVTVTVNPVNDPPRGENDTLNVDENSTNNSLDVLANDAFAPDENESLRITAVGSSSAGSTITIAADQTSLVYTPATGFTGTDTFTYTLSDGELTDEVTVNVTVAPVDPPPTAVNDSFTVTEDDAEASFDVLANDTRDDSNETFIIESVGTPNQGGSARHSTDGNTFFYNPAANFNGTEEVTYTIRDTGGGRSVGTVTFTVNAVNDPPPVSDVTKQVNRGADATEVLAISDLPDNVDSSETLTFTTLGTPSAGGTVELGTGGAAILYTPPSADFTGTDTVTFSVSDGNGETSNGTLTIEVADFRERDIVLAFDNPSVSASHINGIRLRGTDTIGTAVDVPVTVEDGTARFSSVLPGEYMIEVPAIPFFAGSESAREIPVSSAPEDGDTTVDVAIGRIRARYISIRDWLGTSPRRNVLVAVEPGNESALLIPSGELESDASNEAVTIETVELDEEAETLTVRGTRIRLDSSGEPDTSSGSTVNETVEKTFPANSPGNAESRGEVDNMRLFRINVDSYEGFEVVPDTESSNASGEQVTLTNEIAASSSSDVGDRAPEGESTASISQSLLLAPTTADRSTGSDALVLPTEQGDLWLGDNLVNSADDPTHESSPLTVDDAMDDVAEKLTITSRPGDEIAASLTESPLSEQAIDAALAQQ